MPTKAGRLILQAEREQQDAVPNLTLKYSRETPQEFVLDAVRTALVSAKPSFANHEMFMSEFGMVPNDLDFRFTPVQTPTESESADLVQKKSTSIKDAYDSGIINQKIALKEYKAMSKTTGMFTNITDEDIEQASTDFVDENMVGGIGLENKNYSNIFNSSTMDGGPGSGRRPEGKNVNNKVDDETHQRYNNILNGVKTASGHTIKSTGTHAVERAIERKITPEDIKETLEKAWGITPVKVDAKGRPSIKLFGDNAVVAINPDTDKIVTLWKKGEVK
jgi:hypothetical protein